MSHHENIVLRDGTKIGHLVITNLDQVLSIVIHQPWGEIEVFRSVYDEVKEEE
tara:strand:- start:1381 stop:1539 length:159 start_codon:yes stop_codon:yes gene_type:complete